MAQQHRHVPPAYEDHHVDSVIIPSSSTAAPPDVFGSRATQRDAPFHTPPASPPSKEVPAADAETTAPAVLPMLPATPPVSPPSYVRQDPEVRSYSMQAPFITSSGPSTSSSSSSAASCVFTPRFQLRQIISNLGKPYKLDIRRLTTSESRRASLAASSSSASSSLVNSRGKGTAAQTPSPLPKEQKVAFDEDLVVYEACNTNALHRFSTTKHNVELRGCKARTLPGHIELADLSSRTGACKFWHVTPASEAQKRLAVAKMQKWGYKPESEWNRKLLFVVEAESSKTRVRVWKDGVTGAVLASETGGDSASSGDIEIAEGVDVRRKEALLACWACRLWMLGKMM